LILDSFLFGVDLNNGLPFFGVKIKLRPHLIFARDHLYLIQMFHEEFKGFHCEIVVLKANIFIDHLGLILQMASIGTFWDKQLLKDNGDVFDQHSNFPAIVR